MAGEFDDIPETAQATPSTSFAGAFDDIPQADATEVAAQPAARNAFADIPDDEDQVSRYASRIPPEDPHADQVSRARGRYPKPATPLFQDIVNRNDAVRMFQIQTQKNALRNDIARRYAEEHGIDEPRKWTIKHQAAVDEAVDKAFEQSKPPAQEMSLTEVAKGAWDLVTTQPLEFAGEFLKELAANPQYALPIFQEFGLANVVKNLGKATAAAKVAVRSADAGLMGAAIALPGSIAKQQLEHGTTTSSETAADLATAAVPAAVLAGAVAVGAKVAARANGRTVTPDNLRKGVTDVENAIKNGETPEAAIQRVLDEMEVPKGEGEAIVKGVKEAATAKPVGREAERPNVDDTKPGLHGTREPTSATLDVEGSLITMRREFRGKYGLFDGDKKIGDISYTRLPSGDWKVTGVQVDPAYRRRGIATAAYDFLEQNVINDKFANTGSQTADGQAFWAARSRADQEGRIVKGVKEAAEPEPEPPKAVDEPPKVEPKGEEPPLPDIDATIKPPEIEGPPITHPVDRDLTVKLKEQITKAGVQTWAPIVTALRGVAQREPGVYTIPEWKTLGDFTRMIQQADLPDIFKILATAATKDIEHLPLTFKKMRGDTRGRYVLTSGLDEVQLNPATINPTRPVQTVIDVIHEATHARVASTVRNSPDLPSVKALTELLDHLRARYDALPADQKATFSKQVANRSGVTRPYGFYNLQEFIAEVGSNPHFAEELRAFELPKALTDRLRQIVNDPDENMFKTAWRAATTLFGKIMGVAPKEMRAFSTAYDLLSRLHKDVTPARRAKDTAELRALARGNASNGRVFYNVDEVGRAREKFARGQDAAESTHTGFFDELYPQRFKKGDRVVADGQVGRIVEEGRSPIVRFNDGSEAPFHQSQIRAVGKPKLQEGDVESLLQRGAGNFFTRLLGGKPEFNVDNLLRDNTNKRGAVAQAMRNWRQGLEAELGDLSKADRQLAYTRIRDYLQGHRDVHLSPAEMRAAERTAAMLEMVGNAAKRAGVLKELRENYLTGLYIKKPATSWKDVLDALDSWGDRQHSTDPGMRPTSRFARAKVFDDYRQAEEAIARGELDLVPRTNNPFEITEVYANSMMRSVANRRLVDALLKTPGPVRGVRADGTPNVVPLVVRHTPPEIAKRIAQGNAILEDQGILTPEAKEIQNNFQIQHAPRDYVPLRHTVFEGLRVHKDIASALEILFDTDRFGAYTRAVHNFNMATKSMIFMGSMFHAGSLAIVGLATAVPRLASIAARMPRAFRDLPGARAMLNAHVLAPELREAIMNGLTIGHGVDDVQYGVIQSALDLTKHALGSGAEKLGLPRNIGAMPVAALQETAKWFNNFLWNMVHPTLKLATYLAEQRYQVEKNLRAHNADPNVPLLDTKKSGQEIARAVNDLYGGQNWTDIATRLDSRVMRNLASALFSPSGRRWQQMILLAPDWNISAIRAWYEGLKAVMPGVTRKQSDSLYRSYLLWSGATMLMANYIVQKAATGKDLWENEDWSKPELGDGRWVNTNKHFAEVIHAISNPGQTILNKLAYVPREVISQVMGREYVLYDQEKETLGGPPMDTSLPGRVGHAVKSALPITGRSALEASTMGQWFWTYIGLPIHGRTYEKRREDAIERARREAQRKGRDPDDAERKTNKRYDKIDRDRETGAAARRQQMKKEREARQ